MKEQKYNSENTCPLCGSGNVEYNGFERDVETGWDECCCEDCGATWNEVVSMKFRGVDDIQDADGNMINWDSVRQDIIDEHDLNCYLDNYSKDYFSDDDKKLFRASIDLINLLMQGKFEFDTFETDSVLHTIKDCMNRIDI